MVFVRSPLSPMNPKKCITLCLAFLASLCASRAQCPLNVPQPNIGTNWIGFGVPWWQNFDFSQAHNASFATNYIYADDAGLPVGSYLAWCVDAAGGIYANGQVYDNVGYFSSCDTNLDSELPQDFPLSVYVTPPVWQEINYLLNHKSGIYFYDVQLAIWNLVGGPITSDLLSGCTQDPFYPPYDLNVVNQLVSDAENNAAAWTPVCGDVSAVIVLIRPDPSPEYQLMIIEAPIPPTVSASGGNLPCNPDLSTLDTLVANSVTVSPAGSSVNISHGADTPEGNCPYSRTYTITATCGKETATTTATYTWMEDASGPTFETNGV